MYVYVYVYVRDAPIYWPISGITMMNTPRVIKLKMVYTFLKPFETNKATKYISKNFIHVVDFFFFLLKDFSSLMIFPLIMKKIKNKIEKKTYTCIEYGS